MSEQLIKKVKEYTANKNLSSETVNSWLNSFVEKIEMFEGMIEGLTDERQDLIKEIESLKAITELAVKGLKEAELNYMGRASYELPKDTIQEMLKPIRSTISEIERLSHA